MIARLILVISVFMTSLAPAGAATLPYLGGQVEVTGIVQAGATSDRIRVADQDGAIFEVIVSRDSTFVSSHALLRAHQVVRVDGKLVSGRDGAGQTIAAEEISDGSIDLTAGNQKSRPRGWSSFALGAAAGLVLGGGVYAFRKSLFGNNAAPAPGTATLSSGVQFGGGP